jgi:hypothetical protein
MRATELAIKVSRGFAIFLGIVGLASMHLQLFVIAIVVWFMGSAELNAARFGGYSSERWPTDVEVMPMGFGFSRGPEQPRNANAWTGSARPVAPGENHWFHVQRPRAVGGFVIRQHNGRFYIEPM